LYIKLMILWIGNLYPKNQAVELVETLLELIKTELVFGEDVLI
jgi:hypothetical protein